MPKIFHAQYARRIGGWTGTLRESKTIEVSGRSLDSTEASLRTAAHEEFGAGSARSVWQSSYFGLPADVFEPAFEARDRLKHAQQEAQTLLEEAALRLTQEHRLSLRDSGRLLGVSHQRLSQIVAGGA